MKNSELSDDFKFHDFFLSLGHDRDPLYINEEVTLQKIIDCGKRWTKGVLDLQPLIESCPFRLKQNYKINRKV